MDPVNCKVKQNDSPIIQNVLNKDQYLITDNANNEAEYKKDYNNDSNLSYKNINNRESYCHRSSCHYSNTYKWKLCQNKYLY